jgi:tetratricopeptide (TPR) repeat protein
MFRSLPSIIAPLGAALLALIPQVPTWAADQDTTSWVGKRILLRKEGVRIGRADDKGQIVYFADLTDMAYRVLGDTNGWLRVRHGSAEGWFAKDSAILMDEAIPYFTDRLRTNSRDGLAYANRARTWQEKGELERALQDYDAAIRIASEVEDRPLGQIGDRLRRLLARPMPKQAAQVSWYRARAVICDRMGQSDRALQDLTWAVQLNPADPLTYVDRGLTYKGLRDYDKALADLGEAVRLDPQWASAYFHRANLFKARRDYDQALADYSAALRLDPKDTDAYFNRAATYRARKQYAQAAADWSEVVRLDPQDAEAHDRLAWLLATCPDAAVRDGSRAVDHAGSACDLTEGKNPSYLATLAAAFAENGRFDLAVKWQRRALESPEYERDEGPLVRRRLERFENRQAYREEE